MHKEELNVLDWPAESEEDEEEEWAEEVVASELDSGSLWDRRTASGRSSIGPDRQSFNHVICESTMMLQHSTRINYIY